MVVRLVDRRAHQNHLIDQGRKAPRQFARVYASQTVPDDYQFTLGFGAQLGENPAEPIDCAQGIPAARSASFIAGLSRQSHAVREVVP